MKLNKPFSVTPSPLAPPSFSTLANPVYPTQGFSNPGQHNSGTHSSQVVQELLQENTQKPSKRPNKMRVNKHSITPRYVRTPQIYSSMQYYHPSRNLCAKEWVEQHHGTVEEFAAYFSALPAEELEVCYSKTFTIYPCLNSHFFCSVSRPFPRPFQARKLPDSFIGFQAIDWIRDSRCALHLDRFAVIYLHVPLLHSNMSECDVMFDVCSHFVCFKYICRTLLRHIKLFQMICCAPAL